MPNFSQATLKFTQAPLSQPQVADKAIITLFVRTDGDFDISASNILVNSRFPNIKTEYRLWWRSQQAFKLGDIKIITLSTPTECALLLDHPSNTNKPTYDSIKKLSQYAQLNKSSIHIKKPSDPIKFQELSQIVSDLFLSKGINVWIYE